MQSAKQRARDWVISRGATLIRSLERFIARGSLVGNPAFFEPSTFPWARELEADWQLIRAELNELMKRPEDLPPFQELSRDQRRLTDDSRWRTYFFYAFGFRADAHCERCPETARLLEKIPHMTTAFFSILEAGKHLPDHRGTYNGVIRYHLGLLVPKPESLCRIRVGTETRSWHEGESMFFDDTYRHEVWNDSDESRAVLFVDFERPLRFPAKLVNRVLIEAVKHSPFVTDAVSNYNAWEEKLNQAAAEPVG